jgi:hypothetical protein
MRRKNLPKYSPHRQIRLCNREFPTTSSSAGRIASSSNQDDCERHNNGGGLSAAVVESFAHVLSQRSSRKVRSGSEPGPPFPLSWTTPVRAKQRSNRSWLANARNRSVSSILKPSTGFLSKVIIPFAGCPLIQCPISSMAMSCVDDAR